MVHVPADVGQRRDALSARERRRDGHVRRVPRPAEAIKKATTFIFVEDGSFQPYVRLAPRAATCSLADTVGGLLIDAAANRNVTVAIHAWDHHPLMPDDQNNDAHARLLEIAAGMGVPQSKLSTLMFRKTSRDITSYWSIHQKFVVLDVDGGGKKLVKAFFGGLDLTKVRFDWPGRPFLHSDPAAASVTASITSNGRWYDDWYNNEFQTPNPKEKQPGDVTMPRQCWEDFYPSAVGPAAWDVARQFVGRRSVTGGGTGHTDDTSRNDVEDLFRAMFTPGLLSRRSGRTTAGRSQRGSCDRSTRTTARLSRRTTPRRR